MSKIEIWDGTMHIEASIVAHGLELHPSLVQAMMRRGEITSLCERGVNEDAGRLSADVLLQGSTISTHHRQDRNRRPEFDHRFR